jgi:glycosyltransferase involved in cell wall biosynthesis
MDGSHGTMRARLSVALITLNEEQNLPRTLASIRFADEVVVLDSGSTDSTIAIAQQFGATVTAQPWLGFAQQKNAAIERCTGDWVLSLDADEAASLFPRASDERLSHRTTQHVPWPLDASRWLLSR